MDYYLLFLFLCDLLFQFCVRRKWQIYLMYFYYCRKGSDIGILRYYSYNLTCELLIAGIRIEKYLSSNKSLQLLEWFCKLYFKTEKILKIKKKILSIFKSNLFTIYLNNECDSNK